MSSTLTTSNKEISQVFARCMPQITSTPYNNQENTIETRARVVNLINKLLMQGQKELGSENKKHLVPKV